MQATDTRAALKDVGVVNTGLPTDTTKEQYLVNTVGWVRQVDTTDVEVRMYIMGTEYPSGARDTRRMVVKVQGVAGGIRMHTTRYMGTGELRLLLLDIGNIGTLDGYEKYKI